METNSLILKPVLWRLITYNFLFMSIGWVIGFTLVSLSSHQSLAYTARLIPMGLFGGLIGLTILFVPIIKRFNIVISKDKISGPGAKILFPTEVILISEFKRSSLNSASFLDRMAGRYTLSSIAGEKIVFIPFFYGNASYEILCQRLEQEYNS